MIIEKKVSTSKDNSLDELFFKVDKKDRNKLISKWEFLKGWSIILQYLPEFKLYICSIKYNKELKGKVLSWKNKELEELVLSCNIKEELKDTIFLRLLNLNLLYKDDSLLINLDIPNQIDFSNDFNSVEDLFSSEEPEDFFNPEEKDNLNNNSEKENKDLIEIKEVKERIQELENSLIRNDEKANKETKEQIKELKRPLDVSKDKITRATFKKILKDNIWKTKFKTRASFDWMIDWFSDREWEYLNLNITKEDLDNKEYNYKVNNTFNIPWFRLIDSSQNRIKMEDRFNLTIYNSVWTFAFKFEL